MFDFLIWLMMLIEASMFVCGLIRARRHVRRQMNELFGIIVV